MPADINRDDRLVRELVREAWHSGEVHRELTEEESAVMTILVGAGHFVAHDGPWTTGAPQPTQYTLTTAALILIEAFAGEAVEV
jgi:hypothetical protein